MLVLLAFLQVNFQRERLPAMASVAFAFSRLEESCLAHRSAASLFDTSFSKLAECVPNRFRLVLR